MLHERQISLAYEVSTFYTLNRGHSVEDVLSASGVVRFSNSADFIMSTVLGDSGAEAHPARLMSIMQVVNKLFIVFYYLHGSFS